MKARILIVDDEAHARSGLERLLRQEGYDVASAPNGPTALSLCDELAPDMVITDLKMPGMDGIELLALLRVRMPDLPVVMATAFSDVSSAVAAMRNGAADYVTKPIDFDALLLIIERTLRHRDVVAEAENLRRELRERDQEGLARLVGGSQAMQQVYRLARQVAPSRATVLITGESGTGKGEVARVIHDLGPRANAPFVALHCASLAESLLESELFGHERGAFTGAERRRIGRIEQASGGTLFLDEIGEVAPMTQVKLLRVLQERTFERVGGNEPVNVDVRIIAATNRNLEADVRAGRFREDLYYRLNVVHVEMPPLKFRGGDIWTLANHFLRRFATDNGKRIDGFTDAARAKLVACPWPGNVRQLENAIERAVVLAEGPLIDAADLPLTSSLVTQQGQGESGIHIPGSTMAEIERHAILATVDAVGGSTLKAAELLEISVRTIQYRLREYGRSMKKA